ncbi:MAG TPA: protease complex subunit PrcB family protein [Pyrinomonadaceae bacterium]|jgi:hypothetical protein
MLTIRLSFAIACSLLLMNATGAASCDSRRAVKQTNQTSAPVEAEPQRAGQGTVNDKLKVLTRSTYGKVQDAFVAVAHDAETYRELRELAGALPELDADFFRQNLLVAAFLGQRRTGGYNVSITRQANGSLRIAEETPAKGAMLTQALTAPFLIVAVPVAPEESLVLELDRAWQARLRPYSLKTGEFKMTGGIAGRAESFGLEGGFGLMRMGRLATFVFDLKSSRGAKARVLKSVATGVVQTDGSLNIAQLDAGSFVEPPNRLLRAKGNFTGQETSVRLIFESVPSNIADAFHGEGSLEAAAKAPAPPKTSATEM